MEILAALVALESLKQRCKVTIYTDSQYVVNGIEEGWAKRWKANGWMKNKKDKALNPDLWDSLLKICEAHEVEFKWVRGHNAHPENERCDQLAQKAARQSKLLADYVYESGRN